MSALRYNHIYRDSNAGEGFPVISSYFVKEEVSKNMILYA